MSLGYLSGFLKSFDVYGRTDTHGNIAFFTFHTFLVEVHPNEDKNRVRAKLYNCRACICNTTLRLRLQVPLGRPQCMDYNLKNARNRKYLKYNTYNITPSSRP